jgi:hypothetical protein
MIAFEPDLEEIAELAVLGDIARREMIVVIEHRLGFGKVMIKSPRGPGLEQKIVVDEFHGGVVVLLILIRNRAFLKANNCSMERVAGSGKVLG